mmetsp:Transcript_73962/g.176031  ORF Transcript_73962/g.176031 Transcript_73962/m.176031 type:complete len:174 (+) Transcript_73962:141-662(+)
MRTSQSQAALRLAGGLSSALLMLAGLVGILAEGLPSLWHFRLFSLLHALADGALLGGGGIACLLAEIRPHPLVTENAPYLNRLGGRAFFYLFMGSYVIGRQPVPSPLFWSDVLIGLYTLGIALIGLVFAYHLRNNMPPTLSEPALREMHTHSETPLPPVAPPMASASSPPSLQ